MTKKVVRNFGR